ncbi:septation protein 7 [Diutina catenulata]
MDYSYESPSMVANSPMINYRKDAKKGTKFTFMVVGESGTGKTTFINCLLNKRVMAHRYEGGESVDTKTLSFTSAKSVALPNTSILTRHEFNPRTVGEEPGIALTETHVEILDDDGQKLLLNIIDTPGFGENLNNELCFVEIENYLKQQFDLVLAEETRIKRNPRFVDTRVHVLLYFITPTGHGLREIDIACMKRLSKYVNIIPVVGKADSFTERELAHFKQQIRIDIDKFNVPIFKFDSYLADYNEDDDQELIEECKYLANLVPFAIVASEDEYEVRSGSQIRTIRARQYPWGLVDIANPQYSDFSVLKSVILSTHLSDLKELTHDFLYETYRTERLSKVTGVDHDDDEFQDTQDHFGAVPSLSNLAQISKGSDSASIGSRDYNKKTTLDDEMPSPKLKDTSSFTSSTSTVSLDHSEPQAPPAVSKSASQQGFKRLSIGPQRNQLRQISETVPYVIRHERILERQQKLEEMEMASAKELASRAALLEQKAAELKAKEKMLMKRLEKERQRSKPLPEPVPEPQFVDDSDEPNHTQLERDETLTDLAEQ